MKGKRILLLWLLIFGLLPGCADTSVEQGLSVPRNMAVPATQEGAAVTPCSKILGDIWDKHTVGERFLVYGGDSQYFLENGPGDLKISDTAMLRQRFFLPEDLCGKVTQGAALEHLLNRNVFCAGVFQMAEETDPVQMALQWKNSLDQTQWSGGRPQRYLIAQPESGFLLLAYGQASVLDTFLIRMNQAYPESQILMYQEIPQKILPRGLQPANSGAFFVTLWKDFGSNGRA